MGRISLGRFISPHVLEREVYYSPTAVRLGIDNRPTDERIWRNARMTAKLVFEPVRVHFDVPIKINSFYRSPKLNRRIGGSRSSAHLKALAIDMDDVYSVRFGVRNRDFFEFIKNHLDFDQLIWEFGDDENPDWVHVGIREDVRKNRRQVLRSYRKNGKVVYEPF